MSTVPEQPIWSPDRPDGEFDRLRRNLSGGWFESLARRPGTLQIVLLAGCGLLLTAYLLRNAGDLDRVGEVLVEQRGHVIGFFLFTHLYLVMKGLALWQAARLSNVRISVGRAARTFCESALVSLVVAKIAADAYKYARLGEGARADRIRAVLLYRVAAILAVLALSGIVALLWAETLSWKTHLVWLVPALVIGGIVHAFRNRVTEWIRQHGFMLLKVLPFSLGALAAKIGGLAVLLGVGLEGEIFEVAAAFLLIGSLASMTQIPAGLGLLDAGYAVYLTKFAGASGAEAAAFLLTFRLLGPVYMALLGFVSMGGQLVPALRRTLAVR